MNTPKKFKATWIFYLFIVPFLIGGLNSLNSVVETLYTSPNTDRWQEAQAIVLSARLTNQTKDGSTTYKAKAHYIYTWQGKSYSAKRIFLDESYDSNRERQQQIVRQLRQHRSDKNKITIWVDPENPSNAVIYRSIQSSAVTTPIITAIILLSISALGFWGISYVKGLQKDEAERQKKYPDQPWKWKKIWQTNELTSGHKTQLIALLLASIVMTAISVGAAPTVIQEFKTKQDNALLLFAIFPLCTLICWVQTTIYFLRWKRFAKTLFKMDTFPAALGHILRGELVMKDKLPTGTIFNIKLSNIRSHIVKSGNKNRRTETILWQDEQKIPVEEGSYLTAFRLPVLFDIPSDAAPSNWENSSNKLLWRLHIHADIPGADYIQKFEVPVFKPAKHTINTQSVTDQIYTRKTYTDEGDWSRTKVIASTTTQGNSYYFPPARHKGVALSMTAVTAICYVMAIGVPTWISDQSIIATIGSVMFAVVGGLFALVFTLISLDAWLFRSTLDTSRGQLRVRSGMFKMRDSTYQVKYIKQLSLKRTTRVGNSLYYDINATLHSGSHIKLATALVGKRDVTALMDKISQEIGLESTTDANK